MSSANLCDFSGFISRYLPGKLQKISINAALSCPNRDGTKGTGGCIYCNNSSFSPGLSGRHTLDIRSQIEDGKRFFARKYPYMEYLAYFQSYTSTNAPTATLMDMFRQALDVDGVRGLIIGTRPDCMPDDLLLELSRLRREHFVMVEYGAESAHDRTLALINRCHTWADTTDAVSRTASAGIPVGLHLIMGLPGETRADMLATIDAVNALPVETLKCHQLQIVRGTPLHRMFADGTMKINTFTIDEYLDLCCDIVERLRPGLVIERFVSQSPDHLLVAPRWGLKNYQFLHLLRRRLADRSALTPPDPHPRQEYY